MGTGGLSPLAPNHCLSRTSGPKSRTERPRKTKIGTGVAHVTLSESDTTFKVKRSRSPGRFTHHGLNVSGNCSGQRGNVRRGNYCYVAVCSAALGASAPTEAGGGGAYRGGRPPSAGTITLAMRLG